MATKKSAKTEEPEASVDEEIEDIEDPEDVDDLELDDDAVLEDDDALDDDDVLDDDDDDAAPSAQSGDHDEETAEALEELESQELQLLDDEANETLLVDEVKELRAMRREELTLNVDAQSQKPTEFVCQSCFMVKRTSQLANKRKMICQDCVA